MGPAGVLRGGLLVVEDDPLAAALLRVLLERRCGHAMDWADTVDGASSLVRAALAGTEGVPPWAVICDLRVGPVTSERFVTWMKQGANSGLIPVMVISADTSARARQIALDAGADAFAVKSDFLARTDRWMAKLGAGAPRAA